MSTSIENTVRVIRRVEATHRNLGLPIIFAKCIDLANLGVFIMAERAKGKGAILDSVMQLRHRKVLKVARLTPAGLKRIADELSDNELTFINPDITSLYTNYLKDAAINALAHLISEHSLPSSWTDKYEYKIDNCTISFLTGVQPKLLREMSALPNWESMYKDRFIRFCVFYPFGTPDYIKEYPTVGDVTIPQGFKPEQVNMPRSLRKEMAYIRLKTIIERQTSAGRSGQYTDSLLKAHAFLNERDTVVSSDLKVLELFTVNLMADYWLSERESLAGSLKFEPDSYVLLAYMVERGGASRKDLRTYFKASQRTVTKFMHPLIERNIITGTYGVDRYQLNPDWYTRYIMPIINFGKEIGVVAATRGLDKY